jgi:hypothetical protein
MPIKTLIRELLKKAELLCLSPELATGANNLPDSEIYKLFDIYADAATKLRTEVSCNRIYYKLLELPQYRKDHSSEPKLVAHYEHYITSSIHKLIQSIRVRTQESLSTKLATFQPEWMMQMRFDGVQTIVDNLSNYEFGIGQTTGAKIIKQTKWQHHKLASDIGFIIAAVNCPVRNIEDRTISEETLIHSSSGDLEVFDSIHELERIYRETKFGLGIIQMDHNLLNIISDNNLQTLILEHIKTLPKQETTPTSLSLYIISESYNLTNGKKSTVADILDRVPFAQLKGLGISEVAIDFVSCNTAEIAAELIANSERLSKDYDLGVTISFHNGYIFNNITYCYEDAHSMLSDVEGPDKAILQLMYPGFSSVFAENTEDLEKYTSTKKTQTGANLEVEKKLLRPDAIKQITEGTSWKYNTKERFLAAELATKPSATLQTTSVGKVLAGRREHCQI